jgi:TRAP-type mannitol/chloroaromatic compound transport system substrate-binding protein
MHFGKVFATAAGAVALSALLAGGAAKAQSVQWDMQSTYPGSLTQLGTLGIYIQDQIALVSGGDIKLTFQEPGAIVPALEVFDAVATGAVDAGWSTPGYWAGKVPSLQLFSAVPFGPGAGEYLAWMFFGGGEAMMQEIYAPYGIHSETCGIIAPEASGWFKKEITSVQDLQGLKMRFFGLGAKVMEKMGVATQLLAGGDIYPALELGTIDATEFSMPAIDLKLGFYQVAKHYYFPGWHQQSTLFDLMMNKDAYDALTDTQKAQINSVCGDAIRYGLAEGEAIQFAALQELQKNGVQIHTWPPEILAALETAWGEVVAELVATDAEFARVWESLSAFRASYKTWKDLGYLK